MWDLTSWQEGQSWHRRFALLPVKTRDMGWMWLRWYWLLKDRYWGFLGPIGIDEPMTDRYRYATPFGRIAGL